MISRKPAMRALEPFQVRSVSAPRTERNTQHYPNTHTHTHTTWTPFYGFYSSKELIQFIISASDPRECL